MKKPLILALFLTSVFLFNKNAYADLNQPVRFDVPAAQPPAPPEGLLDWMREASQGQVGRQLAYLRVLNILYKNLDISAEFSAVSQKALKDPSFLLRVEGIWVLGQNWPQLNPELYKKWIQTAVRDNSPTVRMEALFALDQPDIVLNEQQKLLLSQALRDKYVSVRKKSYQILSAERHSSGLSLAVSQAIANALAKEPYLKSKPHTNNALYTRLSGQSPKMRSVYISKLRDVDRSDPDLSIVVGKILQNEQHHEVLLEAVQLIKNLRLVNQETLTPLMQLLRRTQKDDIKKEIIWSLANARAGWEALIFNNVTAILFDMDSHTQTEAYYVLEKQLWLHPAVQKNIQTVFKSGWPDFYLSKMLFHSSVNVRTAALWVLSQISEPLNSAVRMHIMDSLSGSSVFNRLMTFNLMDHIPALSQDAAIQKLWLETAQKDPSPMIRADALRRMLHFQKGAVNEAVIRFLLNIVNFDSSPVVQAAAVGVLGQMEWPQQPAGMRKLFTDQMLAYLNHQAVILQNASIWALGRAGSKERIDIHRKLAEFLTHSSPTFRRNAHFALNRLNPDDPEVLAAMEKYQRQKDAEPKTPAPPADEKLLNPPRFSANPPPSPPAGSCKKAFKPRA